MKPLCLIISGLFIFSCGKKPKSIHKQDTLVVSQQQAPKYNKSKIDTGAVATDTTRKIISYTHSHLFSNAIRKDNFEITLFGKNIMDGAIVFEISDYKNKQIFKEEFPASDMLGDADGLSEKQEGDTIKARMARLFDEANFTKPAIDNVQTFEQAFESPDKLNKDNWLSVKADHTAVGFFYSHGYEVTYGIAFSKRKQKVVEIFYSD